MRPLRDQLQREVASLYAFVETVSRACNPAPRAVSYSESSNRFFNQIIHLADRTKKHIEGFERHAEEDNEEFVESRTELWTLRAAWRELHQFIKPSADADTLNQPTAMLAAMVNRLHELRGFESTDFTIFHTDSFLYAQINPGATEELVAQIARIVDAAQPFPANLGLIGIPNSQGNSLFLNCLLAHEIGEYAYAKRDIEASLAPGSEAALDKYIGEKFSKSSRTVKSRTTNTVLKWAKEIFCDLFAVRLIGPCYTFAYVELFDLANLLDKNGALIIGGAAKPEILPYRDHPSHPFRVKQQSEMLRSEGWWDLMKDIDSRQCSLIRSLLELNDDAFIEASDAAGGDKTPFMRALSHMLPEVKRQVGIVTHGIDPLLHDYNIVWRPIAEYLRYGVVPSTLNITNSDGSFEEVHATPIALLNASYRFYLEGIEELMSRIKGQNLTSPRDRAAWMKRIESWTTKALEDVALFRSSES